MKDDMTFTKNLSGSIFAEAENHKIMTRSMLNLKFITMM